MLKMFKKKQKKPKNSSFSDKDLVALIDKVVTPKIEEVIGKFNKYLKPHDVQVSAELKWGFHRVRESNNENEDIKLQ